MHSLITFIILQCDHPPQIKMGNISSDVEISLVYFPVNRVSHYFHICHHGLIWSVLEIHVNREIPYLFFYFWLLSLSIMFLYLQLAPGVHFLYCCIVFHYMKKPNCFILSPVCGHFCCFQFKTIKKKAYQAKFENFYVCLLHSFFF